MKNAYLTRVYEEVSQRSKGEAEFLQAVREVLESLEVYVEGHPELEAQGVLERLVEPERFIQFRVSWVDDAGKVHVNRGYRVQFNSAICACTLPSRRRSSSSWDLSRSSRTA